VLRPNQARSSESSEVQFGGIWYPRLLYENKENEKSMPAKSLRETRLNEMLKRSYDSCQSQALCGANLAACYSLRFLLNRFILLITMSDSNPCRKPRTLGHSNSNSCSLDASKEYHAWRADGESTGQTKELAIDSWIDLRGLVKWVDPLGFES
jgi:hypothetical protein